MSTLLEDEIKRWTVRRKAALLLEIIQGKTMVARPVVRMICHPRRSNSGLRMARSSPGILRHRPSGAFPVPLLGTIVKYDGTTGGTTARRQPERPSPWREISLRKSRNEDRAPAALKNCWSPRSESNRHAFMGGGFSYHFGYRRPAAGQAGS